jgi:hypothetical protein
VPGLRKRYILSENRIAIPVSDGELSRACLVRASPWKSTSPITGRPGRSRTRARNAGEGAAHHGESSTGLSRNGLRLSFSPTFCQEQTAGLSKSSAKKGARKCAVKKAEPKI